MLLSLALAFTQAPITFERVVPSSAGLDDPVGLATTGQDDRLFIVELPGRVRVLEGTSLRATPYLDVTGVVHHDWDLGLRDFAFHPDYTTNGFGYLWYDQMAPSGDIDLVLDRVRVNASDPQRADPSTRVNILRMRQQADGHGGGKIDFGSDGYLYIGTGDGGVSGDPHCNAQNRDNLMGTILRIDVDAGFPYGIPATNPDPTGQSGRPEILHYGLRHPWKWSFDEATGDMWIGDVGQWNHEEVNVAPQGIVGLNYGWNIMEGPDCYSGSSCAFTTPPCGDPTLTLPVHTYTHAQGCSITGGLVYRGSEVPELYGTYLFADYCSSRFWSLRVDGPQVEPLVQREVLTSPSWAPLINPVAIEADRHGEVYAVDLFHDEIFRMVRSCGAEVVCHGEINSTGSRARLEQEGTTSVAQNDLEFEIENAPAGMLSILLYGPETGQSTLGAGTLCISPGGAGLFRAAQQVIEADGSAEYPLDLTVHPMSVGPGQLQPGSRWVFQAWYRDQGATSNLSDALSLVFCP